MKLEDYKAKLKELWEKADDISLNDIQLIQLRKRARTLYTLFRKQIYPVDRDVEEDFNELLTALDEMICYDY